MIDNLIPKHLADPIHVTPFEEWAWSERHGGRVRIPGSDLRDAFGFRVSARGMITGDLAAQLHTEGAIQAFLEGESTWEGQNCYLLKDPDGGMPEIDIHVISSGEPNEYILTQRRLGKEEYEFVLESILACC